MDVLKIACLGLLLTGCHLRYVMESTYYQAELLSQRVPIPRALESPQLAADQKRKLKLAEQARSFAETDLGLKKTKNFTSFVQLDRPYVTYAVNAAPRTELSHYLWYFPFVGHVPYLGFFRKEKALNEAKSLKEKGYDSYVRGVSAYSTLGWFEDPVLSSMLAYEDYDLVNTIIHETVHATVYIKSSADFNEQLATFLGDIGSQQFYLQQEGAQSPTLAHVKLENSDDRLFAKFIGDEIESLRDWYKNHPSPDEETRAQRLAEIQTHYSEQLRPKLKTRKFDHFRDGPINNARLLLYQTYLRDFGDFERAFDKMNRDFHRFIEFCKSLEKTSNPSQALTAMAQR